MQIESRVMLLMDEAEIPQRNLSPNYHLQGCIELETRPRLIEKVAI